MSSGYDTTATMSGLAPVTTGSPQPMPLSNITAGPFTMSMTDAEFPTQSWVFLFLLLLIFVTVVGNVLVCLAIMTEKSLQCSTNYFLLSMAVADLMVALLVMPMGLVKYIFGMWLLGPTLCNIWVSLDVLCCTSSIMHICTISMDRYLAICSPLTAHRRSRFHTPGKIVIVWMISLLLCSPIFILGFVSQSEVLDLHTCDLTNRLFMIYGSIIAFFIPLLIVVVTYGLTAHTLRKKARAFSDPKKTGQPLSLTSGDETSKRTSILYKAVPCYQQCTDANSNSYQLSSDDYYMKVPDGEVAMDKRVQGLKAETLTPQGSTRSLGSLCQQSRPVLEMRRSTSGVPRKGHSSKIKTEQRAIKVLGLVFVAFLVGWMPFFLTNVLYAVCPSCYFSPILISIFEWLGWATSMVNPIIYTIFNRTFQRTFWRLLTCRCQSQKKSSKQGHKKMTTVIEIKPPSPNRDSMKAQKKEKEIKS